MDDPTPSANAVLRKYISDHSICFRELEKLRRLGWESEDGDRHFQRQRASADGANHATKRRLFNMMRQIGNELHQTTSALTPSSAGDNIDVLDICMAPGGFCAAVWDVHPSASICAITLPVVQNGHDILLSGWKKDPKLSVLCVDVTMLAAEMEEPSIDPSHPDATNFVVDQPFSDRSFDLIFCDGQVLRMHRRAEYREKREAWRLLTSQLVVALQRVREGGTLVVLLHKLDAWDTVFLLYTLSKFSALQLFKPRKKHAIRSSFYAVAKDVRTQDPELLAAVGIWKKGWSVATFGTDEEYASTRHEHDSEVLHVLESFGEDLIRLGDPVWTAQRDALQKAPFLRESSAYMRMLTPCHRKHT